MSETNSAAERPRYRTLDDLDVAGKRVLVRLDLNLPMVDGKVTDTTRLDRQAPTLRELMDKGARVVALSHFGRPKGKVEPSMSLEPIADILARALGLRQVAFAPNCVGDPARQAVDALGDGEVALLENLRFHAGEEGNDAGFADELAALGDLFVNDAFSVSHRAHASVVGLPARLPAAAGRCMQAELDALTAALAVPERPVAAIVGGAKVSTKIDLLRNLVRRVDVLMIGGGMANTFLFAQGKPVGKSLCEEDLKDTARAIMDEARGAGCDILLPSDAVIAETLAEGVDTDTVDIDAVPADRMILDIGPATVDRVRERLARCKTLLWNGPFGAFEIPPFDAGTLQVAKTVAELTDADKLTSIAGGGDTVSALAHAAVVDRLSYVSTAGGAFLEFCEGKALPGVEALKA